MRKTILVSLLLCAVWASAANHFTYTADDESIFPNPERGFTEELSYKVSASKPNVVKNKIESSWKSYYKMSLIMVLYNFNHFKDQDLPDEVLAGFDEDMEELRNKGFKCVLRFAYTESEKDMVDATPEWVQRHLEQLKPHLKANADVIYVLEAGFVGVWGEWYYTSNYGNESQRMNDKRRQVIDYLFANVPEDRFILFRYPMIKTEYLNDKTPLTSDEAFSGAVKARMGCHNDAFLNDWGNDGTYASVSKSDDPAVREYVAKETLFVPNGGETNVEDESLAKKVYSKAPEEMSTYHWSFCGKSYSTNVTGKWRSEGIFDELNRKMGYRYQLVSADLPAQAKPGAETSIRIELKNVGYAPLYNERPVFLVLKNATDSFAIRLKTDPRRWLPNGATTVISERVLIPADAPETTYSAYLYLPDAHASIASDPRFAVRFANVDTWEEKSGLNSLQATIEFNKDAKEEGIDTPAAETSSAQKILQDGQIIIRRNNRLYTPAGQQL